MNNQLHKSEYDKMIFGVCGGVAEYLDIDSSIVRIIWAISSLLAGAGILVYLLAAIILPYGDSHDFQGEEKKTKINNIEQRNVIGIILIICGAFLMLRNFAFYINFDYVWSTLLIILGFIVVLKGREKRNKDEE